MTWNKALLVAALLPGMAVAHHVGVDEESTWRSEWPLLTPLLVSGAWFAVGLLRLRTRVSADRSPLWRYCVLFALGWFTLAASLLSPLHELGEVSFTAHMTEHELLMLVAAPLMALSRPISVFLWACPRSARRILIDGANSGSVSRVWGFLTLPAVATLLQICALWLWHVPSLFDKALESEIWHAVQHLSFLGTVLLFWWSLTRGSHRANRRAVAAICLFITSLASGALGALMAVSSRPWSEGYAAIGSKSLLPGGLTATEDQQLAGLIMWIPGGLVHFVAAIVFAYGALNRGGPDRSIRISHA
jgi:putative membrane protein